MLRCANRLLVSARWGLCSSQLTSLVAEGLSNNLPSSVVGTGVNASATGSSGRMKTLQSARHFLRDLDVPRVVQMHDDALELLYFMQRVEYPKQSRLEDAAKSWLALHAADFTVDHMKILCHYAVEQEEGYRRQQQNRISNSGGTGTLTPGAAATELWGRVVFRTPWFAERLHDLLHHITDIDTVLLLARVLGWTPSFEGEGVPSPSAAASEHENAAAADGEANRVNHNPSMVGFSEHHISAEAYRAAVAHRCVELLHGSGGADREPLRCDAISDIIRWVVPFHQTQQRSVSSGSEAVTLMPLLAEQVAFQGLETVATLMEVAATSPAGSASTRWEVLTMLTQRATLAVTARTLPTGEVLHHGCRVLNSVFSSCADPGNRAATPDQQKALLPGVKVLLHEIISAVKSEGSARSSKDRQGLIAIAEFLARWGETDARVSESGVQDLVDIATSGDAPGLALLLSTMVKAESVAQAAWEQLLRNTKTVSADGIRSEEASAVVRALQIGLLRSRRLDREEDPQSSSILSRSRLLSDPKVLAVVASLCGKCCAAMLKDRFQLTAHDLSALLLVMLSVGEALGPEAAASATLGLISPADTAKAAEHQQNALQTLADELIQRVVLASKFSRSNSSSAGGVRPMTASSSGSETWTLETLRTLVVGLGEIAFPTSRQPMLVDALQSTANRILAEELPQWSKAPLELWQVTELLVSLSDTQLFQGAASRLAMQLVHLAATHARADDLVHCLVAMSVLHIRDIHSVCLLLRALMARNTSGAEVLTTRHIVHTADAIRRLRLTQHYQQSGLPQLVSTLVLHSTTQSAAAVARPLPADAYVSLEEFSLLLSTTDATDQRRLFQLLSASHTFELSADGQRPTTLLRRFEQELPSYLQQHPSVCLSLLSCTECPTGFLHAIDVFLTSAAPLGGDSAEPDLFVAAFTTIDTLVSQRKKLQSGGGGSGETAVEPPANPRASKASISPSATKQEERMFAHLCTFGGPAILRMQESQLMTLVATALRLDEIPNNVFRAIGRRLGVVADGLSPENALLCLTLYAKYHVRDDRVVKALLHRCVYTIGAIGGSAELSATLQRVCEAYPHWSATASAALSRYSAIKRKRERRVN